MSEVDSPYQALFNRIDGLDEELSELALDIHANPELAFEEKQTSQKLAALLEQEGFKVTKPFCALETSFRAEHTFGPGGPTITLLAEYDALPEIGHACGHNLIGVASVGAAVALKKVYGGHLKAGRVQVIGTPAEEGGGGKIVLLERGGFEGTDAAMMFHPSHRTMINRSSLAATHLTMRFHGKASHASTNPHLGVNALDACIQTFNAVNALRQHLPDEYRVHGIITHGGVAANIVPEYAEASFLVRHKRLTVLNSIRDKVLACARGAALSVGATVEIEEGDVYAERNINETMANRFGKHLESLGVTLQEPPKVGGVGSSDFGNLSQVVPAIHPYVKIAAEGTSNHTEAFATAAASPEGLTGMIQASKALAATASDLLTDAALLSEVKEVFRQTRADH